MIGLGSQLFQLARSGGITGLGLLGLGQIKVLEKHLLQLLRAGEVQLRIPRDLPRCGNLFLQGDTPSPPVVTLPGIEDGVYTLLMVDPDANMNGSWPLTREAGDHAPVRHWVVGNIPALTLALGDALKPQNLTADGDELTPYKAPGPLGGSHRYGLFLFKQSGAIEFDALDNDSRTNWDYGAFIAKYELGEKLASNFFMVQYFSCTDYDPLACQ